jgi:hypothetical protein
LADDEHDLRASVDASDELGIVAKNRWYVLAETEQGYGLWVRKGWEDGAAFAVFGKDPEGFTQAYALLRKRTRQMRLFAQLPEMLAWVVAIGAIVWVGGSIAYAVVYLRVIFGHPGLSARLPIFLEEFIRVAYSIWLGAIALMVMLWLLRRSREDPPVV